MSDDLDVIESGNVRTVQFLGEAIEVRPLTVGQLPAFVRHAKPVLAGVFQEGPAEIEPEQMLDLVAEHGEALCKAVAVAIGKTPEHVGRADLSEFVALTMAVVAVNLDFFARRLAPEAARAMQALNGAGRTLSSPSLEPGTH